MKGAASLSFGAVLRACRMERELTQTELGQRLGLSQEAITSYENGTRFPRPKTLASMAQFFGMTYDELLAAKAVPDLYDTNSNPGKDEVYSSEELMNLLQGSSLEVATAYTMRWKLAKSLSLVKLYETLFLPLLVLIGDLWEQGKLSVAEEHLLSARLRELVLIHANALAGPQVQASAPRCVCVCAPGEKHDLVLLMLSLVLRQRGWNVFFLGIQVPNEDLLALLNKEKPQVLVISLTIAENKPELASLVAEIRKQFSKHFQLLIGGPVDCLDFADLQAKTLSDGVRLVEAYANQLSL